MNVASKIALIEEEIRKVPYHKGTEHYIGRLKAKLAKLKRKAEEVKKSGRGVGFALKKFGDATVVLIGPPSVGKSTVLNKLTQAHARVEVWPFTTLTVIPGMLHYKGAQIQIFDLPGVIGGASKGIGRGKEVLSVTHEADLILLIVDPKTKGRVGEILHDFNRVGANRPVLIVLNKIDLLKELPVKTDPQWFFISAEKSVGLDQLKEVIWQRLSLMRIYLKPKGKEPDLAEPLIIKSGSTVGDVTKKIFLPEKKFRQILLWGPSARFPGQQVSVNHQLKDEDILEFDY